MADDIFNAIKTELSIDELKTMMDSEGSTIPLLRENRLVIQKTGDTSGKLYYAYDSNQPIEIKMDGICYYSSVALTAGINEYQTINYGDISTKSNASTYTTLTEANLKNVSLGSILVDKSSSNSLNAIAIIVSKTNSTVDVQIIYKTKSLAWEEF